MGASISCGDELRSDLMNQMDFDKDGRITREELMEFIEDERFAGNEYLQSKTLEQWTEQIMQVDVNDDGYIQPGELNDFILSLPESDRKMLSKSVQRKRQDVINEALRKVYNALDINGDGEVEFAEVEFWMKNERSWKKFGPDKKKMDKKIRRKLIEKMDKNGDDMISFDEFKEFFKSWTLRELREISTDQIYLAELAEYEKNPSAELKKKLQVMEEDQAFSKSVHKEAKRK